MLRAAQGTLRFTRHEVDEFRLPGIDVSQFVQRTSLLMPCVTGLISLPKNALDCSTRSLRILFRETDEGCPLRVGGRGYAVSVARNRRWRRSSRRVEIHSWWAKSPAVKPLSTG